MSGGAFMAMGAQMAFLTMMKNGATDLVAMGSMGSRYEDDEL